MWRSFYADPAKILTVQAMGAAGSLNNGSAKKLTVKQGELVQLVCSVAGYPEPTVQWTRRVKIQAHRQQKFTSLLIRLWWYVVQAKYHQQPHQSTTQSSDRDQKIPDSAPSTPSTVVVSNTNEVRIESVVANRDAGYYECSAHNSVTPGSATVSVSGGGPNAAAAQSGLELEVECK